MFYFLPMLAPGSHNIDPCCVDIAVAQNIRQLGNILFNAIKGSGKQLAQVMVEHLAGLNHGLLTEGLHLRPDDVPGHRFC